MTKIRNESRGIKVGDEVGRLTIIGPFFGIPKRKSVRGDWWMGRRWYVMTQCKCGTISLKRDMDMSNGDSQSCGCLNTERIKAPRKHGLRRRGAHLPVYGSWVAMRDRCNRESCPAYANYGGRGIKVCERWQGSFSAHNSK